MKKFFIIAFFLMLLFIVGCTQEVVVTFDSNGGTEIASVTIIKGSKVDEPEAPVRGEDEFLGWYIGETKWNFSDPVKENMTLVAKFKVQGEYQVVFYDLDGNVLKTELVKEGKSATAPQAPDVDGYEFVKWDIEFTNVTKNLEVKPIYKEVIVEYTVTFLNYNGIVLKEEKVSFDEQAINVIARAGEGSVRDTLSIADRCVSYSQEKLTYKNVIDLVKELNTKMRAKEDFVETYDKIILGRLRAFVFC